MVGSEHALPALPDLREAESPVTTAVESKPPPLILPNLVALHRYWLRNKSSEAHRFWRSSVQNDSAVTTPNFVELTSDVVSAYVSNNSVSRADLPALIGSVHAALSVASAPVAAKELTPPIPINFYIVSLEDGRQYRSLKRHLTARGLTPEQYRAKWGLRPDYPMVAPSYSKARSELARALGLGQKAAGRKRKAGKKG